MAKSKRPARVPRAVSMKALHATLGLPEKLPSDYRGYHEQIPLHSWLPNIWATVEQCNEAFLGRFDVIIRATDKCMEERRAATGRIHKSSKHRIFIVCDCGREVPAGRLHQHVCKESK